MLSLEEYIEKRKKEGKINEFDLTKRNRNYEHTIKYVEEFYFDYLHSSRKNKKNDSRFNNEIKKYTPSTKQWLSKIYGMSGKYFNRIIVNQIKHDRYFLLNYTENEFQDTEEFVYNKLVDQHPFIKYYRKELLNFIKEHHVILSKKHIPDFLIDTSITYYIKKTWEDYQVNLHAFITDYMDWISDYKEGMNINKIIENKSSSFKLKENVFNINEVYEVLLKKPFIQNKKSELECMMVYEYLHFIVVDPDNIWSKYYQDTLI